MSPRVLNAGRLEAAFTLNTATVIGLVLSAVGLVLTAIGVLLSIRGIRHAKAADERAQQHDRRAHERANAIGRQVADIAIALGIRNVTAGGGQLDAAEARRWAMAVADVDNDGRDELLVASPWGPHSSMLHVFGQRDEWPESFAKLTEISSGTPAGFTVGDLDEDGKIEIATVQPHGDEPYAAGIRDEVLYRWNGQRFAEIATEPLPRPGEPGFDDPERPSRWHSGHAVLTVRK